MLAPPTLMENILNLSFETEIISDKNIKYLLTLKLQNYCCLNISAKKIDDSIYPLIYLNNFTIEKIKENKYFLQFDNLEEIYSELSEKIKNEKILLIENNNSLKISIPLHSTKIKEANFELYVEKIKEEQKYDKIISLLNIQNKKINELKEKNDKYEDLINKLEEKNKIFENSLKEDKILINNLEQKIKNLENLLNENNKFKKDLKNNNERCHISEFSIYKIDLIENFNSTIIKDNIDYNKYLKNWINPEKKIKAELLYRLTIDGNLSSKFHEKCDEKGPTITLFELEDENKVGIYTPLNWDSKSKWKQDMNSFLFNLNKQKKYKKVKNQFSIFCKDNYGPSAGIIGCKQSTITKLYHNDFDPKCYEGAIDILPSNKTSKQYNIIEAEVFKIIIY